MFRFFYGVLLFFGIFLFPFWIVFILALAGVFIFENYLEFFLVALLLDSTYGVPVEKFYGLSVAYLILSVPIYFLSSYLKNSIRAYTNL